MCEAGKDDAMCSGRRIVVVNVAGSILTELHPMANTIISELKAALEEQELRQRRRIVRVDLAYEGRVLDDSDIVWTLGKEAASSDDVIGADSCTTLQAVIVSASSEHMRSMLRAGGDEELRLLASQATIRLGAGVDDSLRSCAVDAMVEIGAPAACHAAVELLQERKWLVQRSAIGVLEQIGPPAAPHVSDLISLLRSPEAAPRSAAAMALQRIGPLSAPEVAEVAGLLRNPYVAVRGIAAHLLGDWGTAAVPHSKDLVAACRKDPVNEVRSQAGSALVRIGKAHALASIGAPAAAYAAGMLGDPDSCVRCNAAIALGKIGIPAQGYGKELANLVRDPVGKVRDQAAASLMELGCDPDGTPVVCAAEDMIGSTEPQG